MAASSSACASGALTPTAIDDHFDRLHANLIRCEECNENFFFDFLRHPRYFVTHFKACHLKNVLYRFNGCSEEENQRVRFGPRRKKDASAWFAQLKSTEKRMISMQDNKWSEIAEKEVWACRLCQKDRRPGDLPQHAFEPSELGRRQALQHLHKSHEAVYNAFLRAIPAVSGSATGTRSPGSQLGLTENWTTTSSNTPSSAAAIPPPASSVDTGAMLTSSEAAQPQRTTEAQRSRLRRLRATPETRRAEAERSKRRREQLTPAQRQADAERRAKKRQRAEERTRSRTRREDASPQAREREMCRSRERRRNATEQQRQREAQRSRMRRQNATEEQRVRERERCRRRYEAKKRQDAAASNVEAVSGSTSGASTPPLTRGTRLEDVQRRSQQLEQQQTGLGRQLQSLYASLAGPVAPTSETSENPRSDGRTR